jgi:hypothetical protein
MFAKFDFRKYKEMPTPFSSCQVCSSITGISLHMTVSEPHVTGLNRLRAQEK